MPTHEIASEIPAGLRSRLESRTSDGSGELPVLPEIAQQVVRATRDPDTDLRVLAEQIRRDTALAANVLRIANSAVFAGRVPIVSLQHALSRLGMEQIRQIALVIACEGAVFRVPGHLDVVRALFRRSLVAAFVAGEIARLKRRNVEEAYLAGLFHAVGRPVVMQLLVRFEEESGRRLSATAFAEAVEEFAPPMTARVLEHWQIAEPIREAVAHLADPGAAPQMASLSFTVALAVYWAGVLLDRADDHERLLREQPLNGSLDLYPDEIDTLLARSDAILASAGVLG